MKERGWKDKRAISGIIVTLILVALALVAIGVVWAVVSKIISTGSEKITEERFKLNLATQNLTGGEDTGGDEECTPESSDVTCGTWVCGSRTNNCGQPVDCGEPCESGTCVNGTCEGCVPDCTGKTCGSDGCGDNNNCGTCESGECVEGSCVIEDYVNLGVVGDVWPPNVGLYFSSLDLPTNVSYANYYAKFPGSLETRCLIIYDYLWPLEGYDQSIIRLIGYSAIQPGDNYEIWETYIGCSA